MRANSGALEAYSVDDIGVEEPEAVGDCDSDICSSVEMAARDIYQWSESLSGQHERVVIDGHDIATAGLVDARACIGNDAGLVSVSISWKSLSGGVGASTAPCGERIIVEDSSGETFKALTMSSYMVQP